MFPLIAAVEILFWLQMDGVNSLPNIKKILHTAFKLCNDVCSNLIFLASALLFSLVECPVLSRERSYFDSFSHLLSSLAGTGY